MIKKFSGLVVTVASLAAVTACQSDSDMPSGSSTGSGHDVVLTVNITKDLGDTSRSLLSEADGNLACTWIAGDRIAVADTEGSFKGILDLVGGENSAEGRFEGTLSDMTDGSADLVFTYLGNSTVLSETETSYTLSYGSQDGTIGSLSNLDILNATVRGVTVAGTQAEINGVELNRRVAFGRFAIILPEGVEAASVTVSGANIATEATVGLDGSVTFNNEAATEREITVGLPADGSGDIYMTVLPTGEITPAFTVTVGEGEDATVYTATLPARTWKEGEYVRSSSTGDDGATSFGGVAVELVKVTPEEPAPTVDDTVGPTFEVGGRKFKFTKSNLAYNVGEKRWYLLDEQWSFLCKKGWAYANGKYYGAKETDIDLFGFGCTGLFFSYFNDRIDNGVGKQYDEQINAPEYFIEKQLYAGQSVNGTQQGYKYPTQNATCNEGYVGSNLEFGIQGFTMDWGVAYGQQVDPSGNYFTLKSSEWSDIVANYYMCGATITDIKNPSTNKNGVYGCLILGVKEVAEAKALLAEYGATVTLSSKPTFAGTNYQYFDYSKVKMTAEQFKTLEAAGKAVFLPEAGHTSVTVNSYTKTDGYYWTATAGQAYTSTIFRFDGDSSPKVFKLDSQSSRIFGCSVRLVKEVK